MVSACRDSGRCSRPWLLKEPQAGVADLGFIASPAPPRPVAARERGRRNRLGVEGLVNSFTSAQAVPHREKATPDGRRAMSSAMSSEARSTRPEVTAFDGQRIDADVVVVGAGPAGSSAAYWLA